MKKFENPALPAPIYIYGDTFYSPCLPFECFNISHIDHLKEKLKIDDDLIAHLIQAYHKNKALCPNEENNEVTSLKNYEVTLVNSKCDLSTISANNDILLTLLAYGSKNKETLCDILKLDIKQVNLALADRDDLPIDIIISLLNKGDITINEIMLKKGRYNDDETLLSLIDTDSLLIIEAIARKEDISPVVFQALKRFYNYESVLMRLMNNKNLPECMLTDIVELNNLSVISTFSLSFHPQYTQYMDEYRTFRKVDINSSQFKKKVQEFFSTGDFILPLYRAKL